MDLWFYSVDSWVKNIRFLPPPFLSRLWNQPFCQEHRHDIKKHLGRSRASEMAVLTTETTKNYIPAIIWKPKSEKIVAVAKRMLDTKRYTKVTIYIFNFSTQPSSTLTWQVHMVYLRDILHNPLSVGWKRPRCYGNKTEKTMSLSLLSSSQKCSKDYDDEMLLFIRIINPQAPNSRPN